MKRFCYIRPRHQTHTQCSVGPNPDDSRSVLVAASVFLVQLSVVYAGFTLLPCIFRNATLPLFFYRLPRGVCLLLAWSGSIWLFFAREHVYMLVCVCVPVGFCSYLSTHIDLSVCMYTKLVNGKVRARGQSNLFKGQMRYPCSACPYWPIRGSCLVFAQPYCFT